jgi:hypothetical protein
MASSETTQTQTPREKVTRSGRISGLALLVASVFYGVS